MNYFELEYRVVFEGKAGMPSESLEEAKKKLKERISKDFKNPYSPQKMPCMWIKELEE